MCLEVLVLLRERTRYIRLHLPADYSTAVLLHARHTQLWIAAALSSRRLRSIVHRASDWRVSEVKTCKALKSSRLKPTTWAGMGHYVAIAAHLIGQNFVLRLYLCFFRLLVRVVKTRGRCRGRLGKRNKWRGLRKNRYPYHLSSQ